MRITETHVKWWQAKRRPSWAPAVKYPPSINAVINANAPKVPPDWRPIQVENTLALLRLVMKRGKTLREAFIEVHRNCPASPRRLHDVCNWINRIERNQHV